MALQEEAPHQAAGTITAKVNEVCDLVGVVQALCSPKETQADKELQNALGRLAEASQSLQAAAVQEQELRAKQVLGWNGSHHAAMCLLGEGFAEFRSSLDALPKCLPEADAEEVREAVRQRTAALLNPGEGTMEEAKAELASLQQDMEGKKPLQSLLGLREMKLLAGRDSKSRLGQVVGDLVADVGGLLEKYGGDQPVPLAKEDGVMRSLIQKYIRDVITKLEEEEDNCDLLSTRLDAKAEALRGEIYDLSTLLSQDALRGRGIKEQERSRKMKELIDYYLERLMGTQSKPSDLLDEKQQALQGEAQEDCEAYQGLQKYHADRAVAIRQQQQELAGLVSEFEVESHQEEQRARVWDEVHALREQLRGCLDRATALSQLCCLLDRKQLAYEEAERLRQGGLPLLQEAVQRHVQARHRVAQGEELLAGFAACLMRAYNGLRDKAEKDMEERREKAPLYGVRCLAVLEQHHGDLQAQRLKVTQLHAKASRELEGLDWEVAMLEQTEGSAGLDEAVQKRAAAEARLDAFNDQLQTLSDMEDSISESAQLRFAAEAATAADDGMRASARQWLDGFFFTHSRRISPSLPALTAREEESFRGNLRLTNGPPMPRVPRAMLADDAATEHSDFSLVEPAVGLSPGGAGAGSPATSATAGAPDPQASGAVAPQMDA